MATYRVRGPGGVTYKIEAPDDATQAEVEAYFHKQREAEDHHSILDTIHGGISSFLDGALPGTAGVASGIVNGALHPTAPLQGFGDGRKAAEENEERFKEDHPVLGPLATAAGFVGGLALPVTKVGLGAKGAQALLARRMLNSAANGAIMGGAGGALESHADGLGGVLRDTVKGAALGGAVGGALPAAARLAAPVVQPIAQKVSQWSAPALAAAGRALPGSVGRNLRNRASVAAVDPADARASRYIGRQMDKAGLDSAGVMTELQRRQDLGVPAVPADIHEHLREAYGSSTRRPGPATMAVRRAIDARQREMSSRVGDHIEASLGPTTNVEAQAKALNQQGLDASSDLYAMSDAQHIPLTRELQELFSRPSGKEALQIAGSELQDQGRNLSEMGLVEGPDGIFRLGKAPKMPLYDYAKTVLDTGIFKGDQPFATREASRFGKGAKDIRGRLLEIMDGDGSGPRIPQPGTDLAPQGGPGRAPMLADQSSREASAPPLPLPPPSIRSRRKSSNRPGPPSDDLQRWLDAEDFYRNTTFTGQAEHDRAWDAMHRAAARYHRTVGNEQAAIKAEKQLENPTGTESTRAWGRFRPENENYVDGDPTIGEFPKFGKDPNDIPPFNPYTGGGERPVPANDGPAWPTVADTPPPFARRIEPEDVVGSDEAPDFPAWGIPPEGLNPFWKPAREAYAGPIQNKKALQLGEDMAKANATDVENRMAEMTGNQIDHFRLGHRSGMAEDVSAIGDYGNAARRVDGSDKARKAITRVHGQDAADDLFDRLAAEHEGYQTWAAVRGNSQTAGREAADEIAAQEQALSDAGKGLWSLARGRPLDVAKHFAGAFSGEPARTNIVNDKVSTVLSSQDPATVRQALADVRRAQVADRAAQERSLNAGQQAAKVVGSRTGAGVATRRPPPGQVLLGYDQNEDGTEYPVFGVPDPN